MHTEIKVQLQSDEVKVGSHQIRVWVGDKEPMHSDYDFVCVLVRHSEHLCEVSLAKGDLSNAVAIQIAIEAIMLGYKEMIFNRLKGGPASRWATYTHSCDVYDYYNVDLIAQYNKYLESGSI